MFDRLEDLVIRYQEVMGELQSRMWRMIRNVSVS